MKTPTELIHDAQIALGRMANECSAIHDYAGLLSVLMAGPDAESAMVGMQRVALNIRGLADDFRSYHDDATQNPRQAPV